MSVFAASRSVNVARALMATTATLAILMAAAFGVFARLQVVHVYFFLILIFFAHITFLGLGCVSRIE
jgi:hypothetical protein